MYFALNRMAAALLALLVSAQVAPSEDLFALISAPQYEGAIVPASSPWHLVLLRGFHSSDRNDPWDLRGFEPWTPGEQDVALAETVLQQFVEASRSRSAVSVASLERGDIQSLANNVPAMTRQYAGARTEVEHIIVVRGLQDDPRHRWRFEVIPMMGGGCREFWVHVSVERHQVIRISCNADE
jgi:hypothetical protein